MGRLSFINDECVWSPRAGGLADRNSQEPESPVERWSPGLGLAGGGEAKDLPNFMGDFPGGGCPWCPFSTEQSEMISKGTIRNSVASPFSVMFKIGERVHLPGVVQRPEQPWQGLGETPILKIEESQKNFSPLDRLSPSIELCEARWADEMGKQGYGTSQRLHPADPQQSGAEQSKQRERPGRRRDCIWSPHSTAVGAGAPRPCPLLDPCYSRALTKLSDLSQELQGILFGFKIFSLLDF